MTTGRVTIVERIVYIYELSQYHVLERVMIYQRRTTLIPLQKFKCCYQCCKNRFDLQKRCS